MFTWKNVPHFDEDIIALWNILAISNISFEKSPQFSVYKLFDRETNNLFLQQAETNGLYPFLPPILHPVKALHASSVVDDYTEGHHRLGHIGKERMKIVMRYVKGVPLLYFPDEQKFQCTACIRSKTRRSPFASSTHRITQTLELTHIDMTGQIRTKSLGGALYPVVFLDHCTSMGAVNIISNKSQFSQCLRTYKNVAGNEVYPPRGMLSLGLDNAGEKSSDQFRSFIFKNGMEVEHSPVYGSQSNGAAECLIQEFWNMARTMLLDSKLPKNLWAEAIPHANYFRNRLPSKWNKMNIPYQKRFHWLPDLSTLLAFGKRGYAFQ